MDRGGTEDTIRVLHVDDDADFRVMTADFLRQEGDDIVPLSAADAGDGLERLEADAERIDCIVSDYEMPGRDGIEFLRAVREEHGDLPFILFTGNGSEGIAAEAVSAGVTDYVQKGGGADAYAVLANRIENAVDQHRARVELQRRERRLQALLEHSSDRLFVLDEANRYRWVSPAVERLAGYEPDELIGEPSREYVHPDDRERLTGRFESLSPGETIRQEYRVRHADGSWRWVETRETNRLNDPAIEGIVVNSRDVTERVERERRLERERDRFETLFETLAEPGVLTSGPDGTPTVRAVNRAFEETFGYAESDLVGESLNDHIVPEDCRAEAERLDEAATGGETVPEPIEVRRETADGERRDFLLVDAAVTTADGFEGFVIYTDITERREYRKSLERQTERLDEFAGVVSHDLRNPLRAVEGSLELARERYDDEDLDRAARALDRAFDLIENLLAAAREGTAVTEPERVALDAAARRCWRSLSADGATLSVTTDAVVRADEGRLLRLLENLFRNSVEHGSTSSRPEAGDSAEHGSTDGGDATVTVGDLPDGFYVADDGPGIPPDDREAVFEPGYSTADSGSGFGLNIVREIARAHGWSVAIAGDDGGARFEFTGVERGR